MYYTRLPWYKLSPDYSTVVRGGDDALVEEFGKGCLLDRRLSRRLQHGANLTVLAPLHVLYTPRLVQTLPQLLNCGAGRQ